jgi:hypothetical protein
VNKEIACLFLTEFLQRIGPEDITHQSVGRGFPESINLQLSLVPCIIRLPMRQYLRT